MKRKNPKKPKKRHIRPLADRVVSSKINSENNSTRAVPLPGCNSEQVPICLKACEQNCKVGCKVSCQTVCKYTCQTGCELSCQSGWKKREKKPKPKKKSS